MSPKSKVLESKEVMQALRNDNGELKLCLFFGEEDFLIDQALSTIKRKYIADGGETMDYVKLDFGDKALNVSTVRENTELPPWFSSKRLVVVKNSALFKSKETEAIEEIVNNIPDSSLLVFVESKIDKKKKKLLEVFLDNGIVGEFAYQDELKIASWIEKRMAQANLAIEQSSVSSLISRCDKSLRLIDMEINKLAIYCSAVGINYVTDNEISELCPPDVKGVIFDITDAIGAGDSANALNVMNNLIIQKTACTQIRFMMARHLRQLICAKELGSKDRIISELKVHPFVAGKLTNQAKKFTMERLIKLYNQCASDDRNFKSGKVDERHSLESFIVLASFSA